MVPHRMPAAEVEVSVDLVRRLLTAQFPDLAHLPVEMMANGWDNVTVRIGRNMAARMPRREAAARLIVHEQRWLPVLAPGLPLPVPAPVRAGQPGSGYPWRWSIVPFLPGRPASGNPPADPGDAAVRLATFLAALHTPAPPDAPVSPSRGVPLAGRAETFQQNLAIAGGLADRGAVMGIWENALAIPPWDKAPVWVHGDLHPANILVHRGRISAVIDFGDLTSGDPAADLSVAWMLMPLTCHDAFRGTYRDAGGPADGDGIWARARGWALALSLVFLAHSADNPQLARIGRRTLSTVLTEEPPAAHGTGARASAVGPARCRRAGLP